MHKHLTRDTLLEGANELARKDQVLARIVSQYGLPPLRLRSQGFPTLIHIILEQQVSLASANAVYKRLKERLTTITPSKFLKLSDHDLKQIGFSRQKTHYSRELAIALTSGILDLSGLHKLTDQKARQDLMQIKGIGPWTADIYLIVALGRPDIWPNGDLALAAAIEQLYGLSKRPSSKQMHRMSQKWPFRQIMELPNCSRQS